MLLGKRMSNASSEREKLLNKTIGGCKIVAPLGGGGMGYVFKAQHLGLSKDVAIKVLTPGLRESKELRLRLELEARIASKIEHPNVIPIYGVGEDKGFSYIIMRYLEGASLYRALPRSGLEGPLACRIATQVASALSAVHRAGYVHRDVKPENIMLSSRGKAVLMDFGVSSETGVAELPGRGGSPAYMSPEQCRGAPADGRADLYSLGVTLYHMITGRRPFLGTTLASYVLMHQQDQYPPVHTLRAGAPASIVRLIDHLLEKDPEKRPADAANVEKRLLDIQDELRAQRKRASMAVQRKSGRFEVSKEERGPARIVSDSDETSTGENIDGQVEDVELVLLSASAEAGAANEQSFDAAAPDPEQISSSLANEARQELAGARLNRAMARIDQAIQLRPEDANLFVTRASIHQRRADTEAAERDLKQATELAPESSRALGAYGTFLRAMGRVSEAESLLKRAIALDIRNVEARISLGKLYEKAGAFGLAKVQYERAVEHVPADERGYVTLAALRIQQGQVTLASKLLLRAEMLNPNFAPTLYWQAVCMAALNEYESAMTALEKAVKAGFRDRTRLREQSELAPLRDFARYKHIASLIGA